MLELILKALDRIIALAKIQDGRANARFSDIYKPSFLELQAVHTDYLKMFTSLAEELSDLIENDEASYVRVRKGCDLLRHKRIELEPVRHKLWVLGEMAWTGRLPISEKRFLQAVSSYFFAVGINSDRGYASPSTTVLQQLERMLKESLDPSKSKKTSPNSAGQVAQDALSSLRQGWQEVSETFAQLQFESTGRAQRA